jgi:hypothetical protein
MLLRCHITASTERQESEMGLENFVRAGDEQVRVGRTEHKGNKGKFLLV